MEGWQRPLPSQGAHRGCVPIQGLHPPKASFLKGALIEAAFELRRGHIRHPSMQTGQWEDGRRCISWLPLRRSPDVTMLPLANSYKMTPIKNIHVYINRRLKEFNLINYMILN